MSEYRTQYVLSMVVVGMALWYAPAGATQSLATPADFSRAAIRACEQGRAAQDRESRLRHFQESQVLAEQAITLDERFPDGHFALFCTLGEQLRIDGENLTSLLGYRRMMRELERTLELKPDHIDAFSAKGTFLIRLPTLLGGNTEKGEELLRWVITQAPQAVNARINLAKSYCSRGIHDQAIALALDALELAHAQRLPDFIMEIQSALSSMRARQTQ